MGRSAQLGGRSDLTPQDGIAERRPRLPGPVPERLIREDAAGETCIRIDPEEGSARAEVAEGSFRIVQAGPVRRFRVAQLEGQPPVVWLHPAESREHAREA